MQKRNYMNIVNITMEANFDYKVILGLDELNKIQLKEDVSRYLNLHNNSGKLLYENYLRLRYLDKHSGQMLMLFLYRGDVQYGVQYWNLAGICFEENWNEEEEEKGQIRRWLKTRIEGLTVEIDEVLVLRVMKVINSTSKTKFENVLQEVMNEFDNDRDKEEAKKVAFLQSAFFDTGSVWTSKRIKCN